MAAHEDTFMCSSRDSREDREFYQAKTVKTHSNNLVLLTHVQLSLSTVFLPVTSLTWENIKGPLNRTASDGKLGEGSAQVPSPDPSLALGSAWLAKLAWILLPYRWEHLVYQFGCHGDIIKYVIKGGKIVYTNKHQC